MVEACFGIGAPNARGGRHSELVGQCGTRLVSDAATGKLDLSEVPAQLESRVLVHGEPQLASVEGHVEAPVEIVFEVTEAPEGGFDARARSHSIFTQGDDWADLKAMVTDAVRCHFGDGDEFADH